MDIIIRYSKNVNILRVIMKPKLRKPLNLMVLLPPVKSCIYKNKITPASMLFHSLQQPISRVHKLTFFFANSSTFFIHHFSFILILLYGFIYFMNFKNQYEKLKKVCK